MGYVAELIVVAFKATGKTFGIIIVIAVDISSFPVEISDSLALQSDDAGSQKLTFAIAESGPSPSPTTLKRNAGGVTLISRGESIARNINPVCGSLVFWMVVVGVFVVVSSCVCL